MKEKSKIFILLFILLAAFANKGKAQVETMANYVFANDSVAGFDEPAASAAALAGSFYGREYKVFMYRAKRDYVKQKYQIRSVPAPVVTLFHNTLTERTAVVGGACNNEDFELAAGQINAPGAVQGWIAQSGTNPNSCNPPVINGTNNYTVFAGPTLDPKIGALISSYFDAGTNVVPAGNAFIRMNDDNAGAKASKLSKSFIVGPTNALFQYAYLPVIEDGGHNCCEQAGFNIHITITNTTTNASTVLACPQISVAVPSALCQFTPPPGSPVFVPAPNGPGWSYHNWAASAIDLTPYIGNQVTLDVVVVDCNAGGHGGYAYFDAKCAPMDIIGNGTPFPAGTPSVTLPSCGATSATICAPPGLAPYWWAGPGVVAPYNIPLASNQCFSTSLNADFTLSMNPPGSCSPIERVITVTITPAPYILATPIQAVCGASMATITFTAAGSASVNPTVTFSPIPTTTTSNGANLGSATYPAGVGVVTITAKDVLGCVATTTVNINPAPIQPTVAILNVTGSPSITCLTPSVDLTAVSGYTDGTLTFFWSSNSFTANGQNITVTNGSTLITLYATDPVSGCVASATTTVKVNTVAPITSVNPVNQTIGCGSGVVATATGVAVNPSINVTHSWFTPYSPIPTNSGGPVSIFSPPPGVTTTFVVTDNINGCSTSKTVQVISNGGTYPTFDLTSASVNFTLGCSTKSLTDITIANGQVPPNGGAVSYTILPPSYSGGTYTFGPANIYSVNTPGTYTVIVKSNNNACETRIPISVIQNTFTPNISASAITRTLDCITNSVVLTGTSTSAPVTYTWSFQNGGNPNSQVSNTVGINTNPAGATVPSASLINTYTLTIKDQNNFCLSNTVVAMYQNTRPPIPIIGGAIPLTCLVYSVNLSNMSVTGILPNTFLTGQSIGGLLWQGPTPQQPKSNSSSYLGYTSGTYTLVAKDFNNGCTSQTTTVVGDNRIYPVLNSTTLIPLDCGASVSGGVKLPVTVTGLPASSVTAVWTLPNTNPNVQGVGTLTLTTDGPGEYNLTVTNIANQCASKRTIQVTNGSLTANFTPDQTSGFAPLTVNFTNSSESTSPSSGTKSITSVWSFGNGTSQTTTANINTSTIYTAPGNYTVTMFASKGSCLDTMIKVIMIDIPSKLEIPNVFTPNGDNSNDIFFVKASNLTEINAQIFDRWGNKVYDLSTDKGNIAWDGKNQSGKEVPDGTYFYTIKAKGRDGQSYDTKGTISLYR